MATALPASTEARLALLERIEPDIGVEPPLPGVMQVVRELLLELHRRGIAMPGDFGVADGGAVELNWIWPLSCSVLVDPEMLSGTDYRNSAFLDWDVALAGRTIDEVADEVQRHVV